MRKPLAAALVLAACALLIWQLAETSSVRTLLGDFRAFYCGGATLAHGVDPYAAAPLLHCEQSPAPFGLHSVRSADLPAPFPAYALAVFAIFSTLPYVAAAIVWFLLLLAATVLSCYFLALLCGRPFYAAFALVAVAFAISVIPYGELAPVILCALAGGGLALRRGHKPGVAAALLVVSLLPHVAIPVFLAVLVWNKSMRLTAIAVVLALAIADVAAGGSSLALAYVFRVLPSHAASEVGFVTQYSMTWLAQGLGASDGVALALGNISYAVMIFVGVVLAGLAASRFRDAAFLMVLPAAAAVTGGSFIHYSEITLALPAALLLYVHADGIAKAMSGAAALLIAVPWQAVLTQPALIVPETAAAIAIGAVVLGLSPRDCLRTGLAAALWCGLCIVLAWQLGPQTAPHAAGGTFDPALAEASWARNISQTTSSGGVVWWIPKLPTWLGLLLIVAGAWFASRVPAQHRADVA